jgi:hypothetical protein
MLHSQAIKNGKSVATCVVLLGGSVLFLPRNVNSMATATTATAAFVPGASETEFRRLVDIIDRYALSETEDAHLAFASINYDAVNAELRGRPLRERNEILRLIHAIFDSILRIHCLYEYHSPTCPPSLLCTKKKSRNLFRSKR